MENQTRHEMTPRLAPPGAGIPFYQRALLKFYVKPFIAAKSPLEKSKATFEKITAKILSEIQDLSDEDMNRKILVPPQPGLEDSSRYWSISMTLEHLGIVGRKLILVIQALSNNVEIQEKADIGKLKPFGQMTAAESREDFKKFAAQEFPQVQIPRPDSKNRYFHPWFGMMNCREWYWLLGTHQAIHLRQIREIKKDLRKDSI